MGAIFAFALRETHPGEDKSVLRNYKPGGHALLGTGGALMVAGATLLIIDRIRGKAKSHVALTSSPWSGVVFQARF